MPMRGLWIVLAWGCAPSDPGAAPHSAGPADPVTVAVADSDPHDLGQVS